MGNQNKIIILKNNKKFIAIKIFVKIFFHIEVKVFSKCLLIWFEYEKFSCCFLFVLVIEKKMIKSKGEENENTNNKAINCLNWIIGFLIKSSPHNPQTNFP